MESWKEDKRARARHWQQYWRENDRETYECPHCGRGNDEVHSFELHHRDGNPRNGADENLVALCRRCHYEHHGRDPPESLDEWKARIEGM